MDIENRWTMQVIFRSKKETMRETIIEAIEKKFDLSYADLRYADLSDANLRSANLRSANLSYADLSDANLSYANLRSANLRYANLRYADLSDANLSYANLSYANLRYADLSDANLSYANLSYANLRYANLSYADLSDANLRYANLRSANLKKIKTYSEIHEIFIELIRREKPSLFKKSEWGIIGQIVIHYPCWDTIIKRFAKTPMTRIFKILADKGFGEYLEQYKKNIKEAP